VTDRHAVVRFTLDGVTEVQLSGFNHQNVLMEVLLSRTDAGAYRLELSPCFGIDGWIEAREVTISLTAGRPEASTGAPIRGGARALTEE
jgi:hypothetical protein